MNILLSTLRTVIKAYPAVVPHLTGKARWMYHAKLIWHSERSIAPKDHFTKEEQDNMDTGSYMDLDKKYSPSYGKHWYKTVEFFQSTLERLVQSVYNGNLSGEFIDILANLISGQLTQAYTQAWSDEGEEGGELPSYLSTSLEDMILGEFDHVDSYFKEIVDARIDEKPIEPLLARAALWANRYNEAYNEAVRLIALENGEKLEWIEGDTADKCETCLALDGIVAYAWMWEELGVKPQSPPNDNLVCGGWKCGCGLVQTDKRATRGAREKILAAIAKQ